MDIPVFASILKGSFEEFRGGPQELYRSLLSRNDFRCLSGVPSTAEGFLSVLKLITPELLSHGVHVQVLATGQIRIRSREAAEAAEAEEARLRAAFFNPTSAEAASIRAEFGGASESSFQRWLGYKRGVDKGVIHPPRTHAVESRGNATATDPRPIEEQCRSRWSSDPKVRSEFKTFDAYVAYEKAAAAGQVRILKMG
jgi:hypothetical protein